MTELLVGTKKGLFLLDGQPESGFEIKTRAFAGEPVDFATRDPRTGRAFATVTSPFYGPKIFYTDDPSGAGEWQQSDGVSLPEDAGEVVMTARCVRPVERSPSRPERMFMQFHGGVYRSDDAGESWTAIGDGLPSDFGFPLALDPADSDSAYVIPLVADMDRVMPEGRVRVYETRDGGSTWAPRGDGLPAENAYLTVLRQAFNRAGEGESLQLYFGATSGELFGSGDAGATWSTVAERLPPVYSVVAR